MGCQAKYHKVLTDDCMYYCGEIVKKAVASLNRINRSITVFSPGLPVNTGDICSKNTDVRVRMPNIYSVVILEPFR